MFILIRCSATVIIFRVISICTFRCFLCQCPLSLFLSISLQCNIFANYHFNGGWDIQIAEHMRTKKLAFVHSCQKCLTMFISFKRVRRALPLFPLAIYFAILFDRLKRLVFVVFCWLFSSIYLVFTAAIHLCRILFVQCIVYFFYCLYINIDIYTIPLCCSKFQTKYVC